MLSLSIDLGKLQRGRELLFPNIPARTACKPDKGKERRTCAAGLRGVVWAEWGDVLMPDAIRLVLPVGPSVNNLYFSVVTKARKIIRVPSDRAKAFKAEVSRICQINRVRPFVGEVDLVIHVYRARRVGDTDGFLKAPIDALSGYAYHDDKQVRNIFTYRHEDPLNPRIEVRVVPVGLC